MILHYSDELIQILETGLKDRLLVKELRWQASFDLAIGRALATKVRSDSLNFRLAQMKVSTRTFKEPENNAWVMDPAGEVGLPAPRLQKMADRARQFLKQVVREHPGTPFAHVAQHELDRGFGWKWAEAHTEWKEVKRRPHPFIIPGGKQKRTIRPFSRYRVKL